MRNYKKVLSVFILITLLVGFFTLGGCKNSIDEVTQATEIELYQNQASKVYHPDQDSGMKSEIEWLARNNYLTEKEYSLYMKDGIKFGTDDIANQYYLYQGDLLISRKEVQEEMGSILLNRGARHRRSNYMYAGGTISVRIHPNVPIAWNTAIKDACSVWNSLGYNLNYVAYDASNTIEYAGVVDVVYENISGYPNAYASGRFPVSSGVIGERLVINSGFTGVPASSLSERKFVVAHELGHVIGIHHTDVALVSGILDVDAAIKCNGTTSYTDGSSVMRNGIIAGTLWPGFSPCDKVMIDYYWGSIV